MPTLNEQFADWASRCTNYTDQAYATVYDDLHIAFLAGAAAEREKWTAVVDALESKFAVDGDVLYALRLLREH